MTTSAEYIDRVKAEHKHVCDGEKSMLDHAIECGKLLSHVEHFLQEENAHKKKKDHLTLNQWAKQNCGIAQTTVSLYTRLWENETTIKKAGCKTIGEAKKIIPRDPERVARAEEAKALREQHKATQEEQTTAGVVVALTPQQMLDKLIGLWADQKSGNRKLREFQRLLSDWLASTTRADQPTVVPPAVEVPPNTMAKPELRRGV